VDDCGAFLPEGADDRDFAWVFPEEGKEDPSAPAPAAGAKWRPPVPTPRPFEFGWEDDWPDADWQRAVRAAAGSPCRDAKNPGWVGRAVRYLRALAACATPADPAVDDAYALRCSADKLARGVLEARLLADQPAAEIAAACALPVEAVEAYAALFFDVAGKLDSQFHIIRTAIGTKFWTGMTEADLDVVLKAIGYFHGPLMLDAAIRACASEWRVPDRLDGLTAAELRDLLELLDARYFVKVTTTPFTQPERLLPLAQLRADLRGLIAERAAGSCAVGVTADSPADWSERAAAWCRAARAAA